MTSSPSRIVLAALTLLSPSLVAQEAKDPFPAVRDWIKQVERTTNVASSSDLQVSLMYIPDALTYGVAKRYVEARDKGRTHYQAVEDLQDMARGFRKLRKSAQLTFGIQTRSGTYTTQVPAKKIPGGMIALRAGRKRISSSYADVPVNVKPRSIRIRKYLGSEPGLPEFPNIQDPFDPSVSKPISLLMFEEKRVAFPLLVKASKLKGVKALDIGIAGIKKYNGSFRNDTFDVASRAVKWTLLEPVKGSFEMPEKPVEVPEPLKKITLAVELKL